MLLGIRWGSVLSAVLSLPKGLSKGSLRTKIIAWSFVPAAIILLAVALVTFFAFQSVTEELVLQRDLEVTYASAGQLAAKLGEYEDLLTTVARTSDIYGDDPATQRDALKRAGNRLAVFDGGVLLLDAFGTVVAAEPERSESLGQDWSDRAYYQEVVRSQIAGSPPELVLSDIVADGPGGVDVIVCALPIVDAQDQFHGTLVGLFRIGPTALNTFYGDIVRLRIGETCGAAGGCGSVYLVDGTGRVIYHSDADRIGEDFGAQAVVGRVLSGQTDAIRARDFAGNDIVAGFAPLPGTSWGLVNEETWAALTSGSLGYRNFLLFLLVLGVVAPAVFVYFGVRRITKPINDLMSAVQEVARGNFGRTITAQTGDEIEELARQFNLMSVQLQASYANLEQRVADRTKELAALNAISVVVSRSLDLDEVLHDALDKTLQVMEIEAGGIYLLDEAAGLLTVAVQRGFSPEFIEAIDRLAVGEGFSGLVTQSGQPMVVRDVSADPRLTRMAVREEGLRSLAIVPLESKGKILGTLYTVTYGYHEFSDQDVQLLTSIGHQVGVAIENAQLFVERERRIDEMAVLNQVGRAISSSLRLDELLDLIYHQVSRVMDSTNLYIALYDRDEDWVSFSLYVEGEQVRREASGRKAGQGLAEYIIQSCQPLLLPNQVERRLQELGIEFIGTPAKSCLGVPMIAGDEVLGVIVVQSYTTEDVYDEGHLGLLSSIATQAAIAVENARLYEQVRQELAERVRAEKELQKVSQERARRVQELTLLNRVIAATTSRLEIQAVLDAVCRELALAFNLPEAGAALLDPDVCVPNGAGRYADASAKSNDETGEGATLTVVAEYRSEERPSALGTVIPVEQNPATQYVLEHKAPLAVADAQHDPRMAPIHDLMRERGTVSLLILPLVVRREVVGTIGLVAVERREFSDEEIALAANAAAAASQALENARTEEALREAKATAEAANRAKSVFLANMSHELRTPLNAILGFAQLMTRDPSLTPEQQENLEIIGRSGEHLLGLINDVLELSKIEAGRVTLQKESFDLHRLLDGLEEMFRLRAEDKGLMLIFERIPDVPRFVRTDEGKLRQVLMNLLGNAVKFTQEGGITLRVRSKEYKVGDPLLPTPCSLLHFEVEDTGPGIAPEELDAVFDPFVQTASGHAYASEEGTGLGLPISRQFVNLMGGELAVSSTLGQGSIFKFDVQIAAVEKADMAEVQTSQPARRVIGLEPDQPVYRLLVVDEREASRKLLVELLSPLGFELREAVHGQEAIEIWEGWEPHLIWMDMRMPVMDGYEATKRIKATIKGQATVVVALTASAFEDDRAMILSEGCDDFVRKPFREEEIFDTLAKHLGVRFVYDVEDAQPAGAAAQPEDAVLPADSLTPEALMSLPTDWVGDLHQAATQLDADVILDLLDQIREQNASLANALASLVHDFRFDTIMALTESLEDEYDD